MKKTILLLLASLSIGTFTPVAVTQPKTDHASLLSNLFIVTYLYKNRNTVKEMFHKAETKTKSIGWPHFKTGAKTAAKTQVYVVTKQKTYSIGQYPTKLVNAIVNGDHQTQHEIQKILGH